MINHQAKMDILLSSCGTNQFSCSDGACIDLHMRCDLFPDCDDKVCTVIAIPYQHEQINFQLMMIMLAATAV